MTRAAEHPKEGERIETLRRCAILDTPPEEAYDRIAQLAAALCGTPMALVTLIDTQRQWFKAELGFGVRETPRDMSFCAHAILQNEVFEVADTLLDPRFVDNALVVGAHHVRFYAGVPLLAANGCPLGTLCVLDKQPRELGEGQRALLKVLAREVEVQLALRSACADRAAFSQRHAGITAMAVHDINSPLSVATGLIALLLEGSPLSPAVRADIEEVRDALGAVRRMTLDLLDVSLSDEGRMVPRITAVNARTLFDDLARAATIRALPTGHAFRSDLRLERAEIATDGSWIRRIVTNLVDNAFKYSPRGSEVVLSVHVRESGALRVEVLDQGPGVPVSQRERVFEKHFRLERESEQGRPGMGLGLAFCKLAVQALGGRIGVDTDGGWASVFWFELPPRER